MRKSIPILMLTILCIFLSNSIYASSLDTDQNSNQATDTLFRLQIEKKLNLLKRNQYKMSQHYKSMISYLNSRDSMIIVSLENSNKKISNLEDSLGLLNLSIQKELVRINEDQTELQKQSKMYVILLLVLILFIFVYQDTFL